MPVLGGGIIATRQGGLDDASHVRGGCRAGRRGFEGGIGKRWKVVDDAQWVLRSDRRKKSEGGRTDRSGNEGIFT